MSCTDKELDALARALGPALLARGFKLATAESCTGGWIAKVVTDVPDSSRWFDGGCVSYSNDSKIALLGVPAATLAEHGAVAEPTVLAMAEGARARFGCAVAIAVSGIAGPSGGSPAKPVGTVYLAWATPAGVTAERAQFAGDRESVRRQTVALALARLIELVRHDERT